MTDAIEPDVDFDPGPEPDTGPPAPGEEEPFDADELIWWVHTVLLPTVEESVRSTTWCPRWWEHPEALTRMEIVRRNHVNALASNDAQALSDWRLGVADAHLRELLRPTGPFSDCAYSERRARDTGDGFLREHQPRGLPQLWPEDYPWGRFDGDQVEHLRRFEGGEV